MLPSEIRAYLDKTIKTYVDEQYEKLVEKLNKAQVEISELRTEIKILKEGDKI